MNAFRKVALGVLPVALVAGGWVASAEPAKKEQALPVVTTYAKVDGDGNLLRASGVTEVDHFGIGRYILTTENDVNACGLIGTVNSNGSSDPGPGSASIMVTWTDAMHLFVRTATPSSSGSQTVDDDRPFTVMVVC
ncbi:hypothetical protein [Kitasatospora griseola]|uniref:hypothetical protein n=1 Tax=Kitasatospora griseola TaxID=2064 RepID=UPI00167017DC|nr:hypothetical protein [Kitasatospora griseola]GGR08198.1 hypothetical protein GCM10010195_73770 [Kitasatospora griseola]